MEIISDAIDAIFSTDDDSDRWQQAHIFLINEVANDPNYINYLKDIYLAQVNPKYKIFSLIMIKNIVINCFNGIQENIQGFLEIMDQLIQYSLNTQDTNLLNNYFKHFAAIINRFASNFTEKNEEIWENFIDFLVLYRTDNRLIPFCIYLYLLLLCQNEFYPEYLTIIEEINPEIILRGLQCDYIETQLNTITIFSKIFKNVNEDIICTYQEHFGLIYQMAGNSLEINEIDAKYFYEFWSLLFIFDTAISKPLFEVACSIIDNENLSPINQSIVFQFIIRRNELITENLSSEDIEKLAIDYFHNQYEIAEIDENEVDCSGFIFANFIEIDEEKSYELFKGLIYEYLHSEDPAARYVGLCFLTGFFFIFGKVNINDISEFLPIAIEAATGSEILLKKALLFIESFLHYGSLNLVDSNLIIDFIINVIVECTEDNIQYRALNICKSLTPNSIFFEKMIGVFANISDESLAAYFSILIYFYYAENQINMARFEPFLIFLIKKFNEFNQKVAELNEAVEEDMGNEELLSILYQHTLVQCSAANLIIYFGFVSPLQLEDYVQPAIESIMAILEDKYYLREKDKTESDEQINNNDYISLSLRNIKYDFTSILMLIKDPIISLFEGNFEIIVNSSDTDDLKNFLCSYLDEDVGCYEKIIKYFNKEIYQIFRSVIRDRKSIVSTFKNVVFPMSKWIHKIKDVDVLKKYIAFINYIIRLNYDTFDVYTMLSKILLRIVKPKRIESKSQNPLYANIVIDTEVMATKMVEIIPKIKSQRLDHYFDGFSYIALVFAYLKNKKGLEFLNGFIIPFYKENQETTEAQMLTLFSKLINLGYYNDEVIQEMLEIVKGICERGKIYQEFDSSLFNLITDLSKIHPEISPLFIEIAIATLNETKDDEAQISLCSSCALFLLSAFNQNHEEFQEAIAAVIPDIFAVFPVSEKHKTVQFWFEIKTFVEACKDQMTKEIFELLIGCLTRYLSYQKFTYIFFSVPDEQHDEIIQFYGQLIESYLSQPENLSFKNLLDALLLNQPTSVEYILSLYSRSE